VGRVSSLFAQKVVAQVDPDLDRAALLRGLGLDADGAVDASVMVRDTAYYAMLETIAARDPGATDLPLRVGATLRCADYGAWGLAFQSATTLGGSWARCERYGRFLTDVSRYHVEPVGDEVDLRLHRSGERRLGLRLSNEATLASCLAISREVAATPFALTAVFFRHPAPATTTAHRDHFGCPVHFDSDRDALRVSKAVLDTPNRLGDESTSRFFDAHLTQALAAQGDAVPVEERVRSVVARALSEGVPSVAEVAARLGTSRRTLQRRLAAADRTFQALVDEARRDLAQRLLAGTDYPLADVAFLTGFSEQSAFTRAFRRWSGSTPRAYRLRSRSR
jgi:AraC-like DNA-binding protein